METFRDIKPGLLKQSAVALGFFDGVHLGHQAVITKAVREARRLGVPSALATFCDHPRTIITGKSPQLLTQLDQRLELFAGLGIDYTLAISFTEDISRLSADEYVRTTLLSALGCRSVAIGYNHHFGKDREGSPQRLNELGKQYGFDVHIVAEIFVDGVEVSSSRIREAIATAKVDAAGKLLGRPYSVSGQVIRGDGRGRGIGFPTANISIPEHQLLPARGVYAGATVLKDGRILPAVINIGFRPTVSQDQILTLEVHILDFNEDLYGQTVTVQFWRFLRAETKFENIQALKGQIELDCRTARDFLPVPPHLHAG